MAIKEIPRNLRIPNWERELFALIDANRDTPFQWGEHDCIAWGAACVTAITGKAPVNNKLKRKDEKQAARLLKKIGGVSAAVTMELGDPMVNKLMARRGDIVVLSNGERECVGVCVGDSAACVDYDGMVFIPMTKAVSAWRV
jgi:formylmethanofuran dehydrogenase subunit D